MKLVEYCDIPDTKKLMAVSVSGYSFRRNGGLHDAELILYTTYPEKAREDKYVSKIYDRVERPIVDLGLILSTAITCSWERATWEKFACWAKTPCDGEPVFMADYDTVCLGDVTDAIPPYMCHFSGRYNSECRRSCNGGFYCKVPKFDIDNIAETVLEPVYNDAVLQECKKTWWCTDEIGVTNYFNTYGYDNFYSLEWKFNMTWQRQKQSKESVQTNDVRVLHYMGTLKPWDVKSKQRYAKQRQHWYNAKRQMMEDIP